MSLNDDNGSRINSLSDFLSNLQVLIITWLVEWLSLLEKSESLLEKLEIDCFRIIKVSLLVNLLDLLVNLLLGLFNIGDDITLGTGVGSASAHASHVTSHRLVEIDQIENTGVEIEFLLQFLLDSLSNS